MNPMDAAWVVLKNEPMSDEDYLDNERQIELDHTNSIFIEDFGEVPKEDYYNAEWWWNHPHEHINSVREEGSIEELQMRLDAERRSTEHREARPNSPSPGQFYPFEETRPQMDERLTHISNELGRRAELGDPGTEPDPENPMVGFTRPEMMEMQEEIEREKARRKAKKGGQ